MQKFAGVFTSQLAHNLAPHRLVGEAAKSQVPRGLLGTAGTALSVAPTAMKYHSTVGGAGAAAEEAIPGNRLNPAVWWARRRAANKIRSGAGDEVLHAVGKRGIGALGGAAASGIGTAAGSALSPALTAALSGTPAAPVAGLVGPAVGMAAGHFIGKATDHLSDKHKEQIVSAMKNFGK
jgi:hypothetical protein